MYMYSEDDSMHTNGALFSDPQDKEELTAATIKTASVIDDGEAAVHRSQKSKNIFGKESFVHITGIIVTLGDVLGTECENS